VYGASSKHPIHTFKAAIGLAWDSHGKVKLEGDLAAIVDFVFYRPSKVAKKLGTGTLPKTTKPDLDNLVKGVLDSLNGLAYHDDSQVSELHITKCHAAEGQVPGVTVTIIQK